MQENWQCIYSENQTLIYEGFTVNGKPYGAGTVYYPNGSKYQEGVFGIKGLLVGREYYSNGNIRFEGVYSLNCAYGPNYPYMGTVYDHNGQETYNGIIKIKRSGLGYPCNNNTPGLGQIVQSDAPKCNWFMWENERQMNPGNS